MTDNVGTDRLRRPFVKGLIFSIIGMCAVTRVLARHGTITPQIVVGWCAVVAVAFSASYLGSTIGLNKAKNIIGFGVLLTFLAAALAWVVFNGGFVVHR